MNMASLASPASTGVVWGPSTTLSFASARTPGSPRFGSRRPAVQRDCSIADTPIQFEGDGRKAEETGHDPLDEGWAS